MSYFDVTNAQTAMTVSGTDYSDLLLNSINVDNPQTVTLVLDHQQRTDGFDSRENTDQPVTVSVQLRGVESEFYTALKSAFKSRKRVDFVSTDPDNDVTLTGSKMLINKNPQSRSYEAGTATRYDIDLILLCANKNWDD